MHEAGLYLDVDHRKGLFAASIFGRQEDLQLLNSMLINMPYYDRRGKHTFLIPYADFDTLIKDFNNLKEDTRRYFSTKITENLAQNLRIYENWLTAIDDAKKREDCEFEVDGLKGEMYPYQRVGADFLVKRKAVILSDDIGTGKTLIAAGAAWKLYLEGLAKSCWVIVPASVKYQWVEKTLKVFLPDATYTIIDGLDKTIAPSIKCRISILNQQGHVYSGRSKACKQCTEKEKCRNKFRSIKAIDIREHQWKQNTFFKIANYELLRIDGSNLDRLVSCGDIPYPDTFILDEGHRIRNKKAGWSKAVLKLSKESKYRWLLSGTPLQNYLEDLYNCMSFVRPGTFGRWTQFKRRYIPSSYFDTQKDAIRLDEIAKKISTSMIRRTKAEVLSFLPPKIEQIIKIPLSKPQRKFYDETKNQIIKLTNINMQEKIQWATVLSLLTYLREAADSTELIDKESNIYSTKLDELKLFLESIIDDHKVVIFSMFEKMTKIIERELPWPALRLHGGVPNKKRDALIKKFEEDDNIRIFAVTTAGEEGIDGLQYAADWIIFFDLPWNTQRMRQIEGRVHRSGQKNTVNIMRFIAENTIEERIWSAIESKEDLFNQVINGEALNVDNEKFLKKMVKLI